MKHFPTFFPKRRENVISGLSFALV